MSHKASQVLLSLLLVREPKTQFAGPEFAIRAGVVGEVIPTTLAQLGQAGLITIVSQGVKQGTRADKEIVDGLTSTYGSFDAFLPPLPILPDTLQEADRGGSGIGVGGASTQTPGAGHNGEILLRDTSRAVGDGGNGVRFANRAGNSGGGTETGHNAGAISSLDLCREADASGRRPDQIKALQAAWAEAFPLQDYEYQQLQVQAAKHFLVGRSAEEVGEVILDAPKRTRSKIESPRAYIESVLAGKQKQVEDEPTITDELRDLARQAKEQIRARKAADQRRRDEYGAS